MDSCHKPIPIQKCGTRRLDPNNEFCCNNQAYSQSSKQCCCIDSISGKQDVYAQDRICCGGQLFNKTGRLGERTCCGAQVHNESDPRQLCCRPHQHQIDKYNTQPQLYHYNPDLYPNWDTSECCGIDVFDNSTQKCCNNNINNIIGSPSDWFCCNKTVYNQRSHQCLKDDPNNHIITLLYHELCNGAPYDQRTNTCCDGQLHPYHDVSQFQCCGTEIQNKETQQCCNKTLSLVISNSRLCCGNRSTGVDSSTQRCCTNPSDPTTNLVHAITTKAQECCGNGLFHNDTQFCCRGQPYLRSRYKRCGNPKECVVVSRQEKCCGVHQLDTSHTCCGKGLLVAKTSSAQDDCCYNSWTRSGQSFVSETHQCVRGKVEVKAKRCGNEIYDDTSDLCCNNNLFRGAKEIGKKCCAYEVYHNRTQQCCSFEVVNGTDIFSCPVSVKRRTSPG